MRVVAHSTKVIKLMNLELMNENICAPVRYLIVDIKMKNLNVREPEVSQS